MTFDDVLKQEEYLFQDGADADGSSAPACSVFVVTLTDWNREGEVSVVAVAGTKEHALAYIRAQLDSFQKEYDFEEYSVIQ